MEMEETKGCSLPSPLTDDEISSTVDGHPSRHARAHLRRCTYCLSRVETARRLETSLGRTLHRFDCFSAHQLGEFVLGLLDESETSTITSHLSDCARCSSEVSELRAFVHSDEQQTLPAGDMAEVATSAQPREIVPKFDLGELIAKLLPRSPALAYRGVASGREPLVAQAGDVVITLDMQPVDTGTVAVNGMLATLDPNAWVGALAILWVDGAVAAAAMLDENGGFALGPLPRGHATLRITLESGSTLVLPDIQLG